MSEINKLIESLSPNERKILPYLEEKTLEKGFEQTLKVIDQLNELDTSQVKPTSQVTGLTNVWREDKVDKSRMLTQKQALSNAKKTHKGYFVVPAVIRHET